MIIDECECCCPSECESYNLHEVQNHSPTEQHAYAIFFNGWKKHAKIVILWWVDSTNVHLVIPRQFVMTIEALVTTDGPSKKIQMNEEKISKQVETCKFK